LSGPGGPGGRNSRDAAIAAGVALLGGLFLWELVLMVGVPVARDMQMFFIPQKHLLWEALQAGRLPLWTPFVGTGAPLLANFQSGVFYPPHWLYAFLPFLVAFNLLVVLHFMAGGVFAYLLARKVGLRTASSFTVAAAFMLGGYFASLLNLINAQQAAAWAPALAWAVLHQLESPSAKNLARLIVVAALGILAGEPQTFLIGAFFAAVVALTCWPAPTSMTRSASLLGSLALAAVAVAGLVMIQVLPTVEMVAESGRGSAGLAYEDAAFYSIHPSRLSYLLVPSDFRDPTYQFGVRALIGPGDPWLFSVYLGALFLPLLVFAWRLREERKRVAVFTTITVLGILLALGEHAPLHRWLYDFLPGFAAFRFPEKFFLFAGLGSALLMGYGVEALRSRKWSRADLAIGLFAVGAPALVLGFVLVRRADVLQWMAPHFLNAVLLDGLDFAYEVWTQNLVKLVAILGIGLLLVTLYRRKMLAEPLFAGCLLALIVADFAVAHRGLNPTVDADFYQLEPAVLGALPVDELRHEYRYRGTQFAERAGAIYVAPGVPLEAQKWMWQHTLQPNTGQLHGVLQVDTWDAIKLNSFIESLELYRQLPDDDRRWKLLRLTSVKYLYSLFAIRGGEYEREIPLDSVPGYLYEVRDPLPRAYVADRARYFATDVDQMNALVEPGFDSRTEVALIGETPPGDAAAGEVVGSPEPSGSTARVVSDSGEEVRIHLSIGKPGYLVLTDSYYPGWVASVDGQERPILRANRFFRALEVRPGDAEASFRYRSRPFQRGRWISLITLALTVFALGLGWRRQRAGTA
jgi:hypothetical protein